jgi:hypothetical protein
MMKSSKKNSTPAVNVVTLQGKEIDLNDYPFTPCISTPAVTIDSLPAIPLMHNRLMRINHGISTLQAKAREIETAISRAPVNLQTIADDCKINAYITSQAQFGVEMSRDQAIKLLQIVRADQPVNLTGGRIPVKVERDREPSLSLSDSDKRIMDVYKSHGFLTNKKLMGLLVQGSIQLESSDVNRYSNIAKQVSYLQGKEDNNGYLSDIAKDHDLSSMTAIEILSALSNHPKAKTDQSTFALTKRAVKIWYHLNS